MALAIDSGMQVPAHIQMAATAERLTGSHAAGVLIADVDGFRAVRFMWESAASAWQVQWRIRKRCNPNSLLPTTDYSVLTLEGTDWWTEWTDWQGADITGETVTPCTSAMLNHPGAYMDQTIPIAYDFAQYDRWDFVIRVRAVDPNARKCSNWGESDVYHAGFCPRLVGATAAAVPGKGWRLSLDTNWHRGGNDLDLRRAAWLEGTEPQEVSWFSGRYYSGLAADPSLLIPCKPSPSAESIDVELMDFGTTDCSIIQVSPDGYQLRDLYAWFYNGLQKPSEGYRVAEVPVTAPTPPTGVTASISATAEDGGVSVSVSATGSPTSAVCEASWTDAQGIQRHESVELSTSDGGDTWTGRLDFVPFDTEVTVAAAVAKDDQYAHAETVTATVPSNGIAVLSWPGAPDIALRYNPKKSGDWSQNAESVQTAGRELPVSRYGVGGQLQLALSGVLLDPSVECGDAGASAIVPLREPHDWVLRYPGGELYRVSIASHSASSTYESGHTLIELSLTMEAVGYGVD